MATPVVTRFAPSPTGYLHIGGARTALFNWAFARHTGGKMLLRIEDTDRERSTDAAVQAIFDGLKWLGLTWDGEPFMQFSRAARHAEVANELLKAGQAYYCYCSPEELTEMRETARAKGLPPRYNGYWRDRDHSEAPAGVAPVIIALAIATIPDSARIARSIAESVMKQEFIEAGRAVGLSDAALFTRYLARNCVSSIMVFMSLRFGQVILLGAALSFLGLGARPPAAELGMMASQGRDAMLLAPHVAIIPSLAIFVIVLTVNIAGDALRDVLDPRLRT